MKIKILVIFFLALIFSFIIYDVTLTNRKSILMLGDNHLTNNEYKTYDKYLYDDLKNDVVFFNELFTLDKNEMCVCDIANVLSMTKSAVSHQLATLRRSGIVRCRKSGKEVYYTLDDDHIVKLFEIGLQHIKHRF